MNAGLRTAFGRAVARGIMASGQWRRQVAGTRRKPGLITLYGHDNRRERLEPVVLWLRQAGFAFVALADVREAARRRSEDLNGMLLTMDDAWLGNLTHVIPVAQTHDIPVTVFVATEPCEHGAFWWSYAEAAGGRGAVERLKRLSEADRRARVASLRTRVSLPRCCMNPDEVADVAGMRQVTIGSHTVNHAILTQCAPDMLAAELRDSRQTLARWTGYTPYAIAYPNGNWNPAVRTAAREAGYELGFTIDSGVWAATRDDALSIPRRCLTDGSLEENLCRVFGCWPLLREWKKRLMNSARESGTVRVGDGRT